METPRLVLRPWSEQDAEDLYRFARDPMVGPPAGWPPHTDVEHSLATIRGVLSQRETYAMVLRHRMTDRATGAVIEAGTAVGSVGIQFAGHGSYPHMTAREVELGYWVGVPLWGHGLVPEAVRALLARCFGALDCDGVWCGYYEGNEKSRRVQEKCGFTPRARMTMDPHPLNGATAECFTYMTRESWVERQRPVTHSMTLGDDPFQAILSGSKRVELRLYDAKRQAVRIGDAIRFTHADTAETITASVTALHVYESFSRLYRELIPRMGAASLGYRPGEQPDPTDMNAYYTPEAVARHGVVGIELTLTEDMSHD